MRIQEMKSGMTHLKKREAVDGQDTFFDSRDVVLDDETESRPAVTCDLDEPQWSVISFDKIEAGGMSYHQAVKLLTALNITGIAGLCIVTDAAAGKLKTKS